MNPNSALNWLPKIEAVGLPTPKTIIIPYAHHECAGIFYGEKPEEFESLIQSVRTACEEISYPVFIRTDLASAKHSGPSAYKIDSVELIECTLFNTLEHNEMAFWMEREGPQAILVREFLTLDAPFTAFRGLPIAREWRLFSDGVNVICAHAYWPAESLEGHVSRDVPDWREKLAELEMIPAEMPELERMAITAAAAQGSGSWSVDFCRDVAGKWWLPDMAVMADSFHWPGCPNGAER